MLCLCIVQEQGHFKSTFSMSKQTFSTSATFEENKYFLWNCTLENTKAEKIGHGQAWTQNIYLNVAMMLKKECC